MPDDNAPAAAQALDYPRIASRVFNTPLMIEPNKLSTILAVLGPRLGFQAQRAAQALPYATPAQHEAAVVAMSGVRRDPGYVVYGRVGVIPIVGTLVQRAGDLDALSGMLGYGMIERRLAAALRDPEVEELVLEIDSPGGEVSGLFDLADLIFEARGEKPIIAVASEIAASAAYLIASAADEVVVPRTGMVGSIGVVAAHFDHSGQLQQDGVVPTLVYAGDRKVDGNPFEPLSDRAREDWQKEIDEIYGLFVRTVARNRGLREPQVRGTQAGMYMGREAVSQGLASRVNTLANEIRNAAVRRKGERPPGTSKQEAVMPEAKQTMTTAEPAPAPVAEPAKPAAQPPAKAEDPRGRIKAILESPEAKGREDQAKFLAFDTEIPAELATQILGKAPQASSGFREAMTRHGGAGIEDNGDQEQLTAVPASTAEIYARRRKR